MSRSVRVAILALIAALSVSCDVFELGGIERDPSEAGVDIRIVKCEIDKASGVAAAVVEVTSKENEYSTVLVQAELLDKDGTVVAQGSSSVSNVEPGKRYRLRIVYGGTPSDVPKEPRCEARLEFASKLP